MTVHELFERLRKIPNQEAQIKVFVNEDSIDLLINGEKIKIYLTN